MAAQNQGSTTDPARSLVSLVAFEAHGMSNQLHSEGLPDQLQDVGQNSPAVHDRHPQDHNQVSPATSIYAMRGCCSTQGSESCRIIHKGLLYLDPERDSCLDKPGICDHLGHYLELNFLAREKV
jgi:hypothetical protein